MKAVKVKKGLSPEEFQEIKVFLAGCVVDVEPLQDRGTCVIGNRLTADVMLKGKRLPTRMTLHANIWTQCEQYELLMALLGRAQAEYPHLAQYLRYDCGNMD